jgi:hypothetical protein
MLCQTIGPTFSQMVMRLMWVWGPTYGAIRDGNGNAVGGDVVGQVLSYGVTFKLHVDRYKEQCRAVDYQVKRDITSQGYEQRD